MDKRGQLYIMSAIIIAFILYIIITPSNIIKKTTETSNFQEIAKNFDRESSKFLNSLIKKKQDIYDSFLNFTILFTSYSKTKNPNFGLIYAFIKDNKLYIGNYLQDEATFKYSSHQTTIKGCLDQIKTSFSVAGLDVGIPNVNILNYQDCLKEIPITPSSTNEISITITEPDTGSITTFKTEISENNPDLIIISKEKKDNIRRIYTKGKFI